MSFFGELRRRNVVKVAVAYAIVGWVLIEVSTTVLPLFEAPDWIAQVFAFFIILGFPVALILSWAYELTSEGIKLERDVPAGESITHVTGRKIDFAIIGALVLALGFVVFNYVLEDDQEAGGVLPNSVAVIPFQNMSADPEDAYYASGIHEEILNQLVKLSALNVIARTSVQQYANTEKSIPEIAEELNVETVMEGSVRYSGGQIRITTQLNDGITGAHLWSETYTRDFDDIFAIESDVAMNVANALEAEFSLEEQASLENIPTDSSEAYRFYLAALEVDTAVEPDLAIDLFDRAIAADPNFALAYVNRASLTAGVLPRIFGSPDGPNRVAEQEALALQDVRTALALDSNLAGAHVVLADIADYNWSGAEAQTAYERALELSPNDPAILSAFAAFKARTGQSEDALIMKRRALQLDPTQGEDGNLFEHIGDLDSAASAYRISGWNPTHLALVEIVRGNSAVAESLLRLAEQTSSVANAIMVPQDAYGFFRLGLREDAERMLDFYEEFSTTQRVPAANRVIMSLARGDEAGALEWLKVVAERAPYEGHRTVLRIKDNVFHDPILDEPEFVAVRKQLGFTDL